MLIVASCGGGDVGFQEIDIPADPERSSPAPFSGSAGETTTDTYAPLDLGFLGIEASSPAAPNTAPNGLQVGFTEEGYPYRGSPDAKVTIVEYSDYACPFCGRHTLQSAPALLEQYAATGLVRFVFREFPLVGIHPTAPAAHTAALCAGEQSPELYWAVHDEIFARQGEWTNLPDPREFLAALAAAVGVDQEAYAACVASGVNQQVIDAGIADGQALGFSGTPSFHLIADDLEDGYILIGAQPVEAFVASLDALLAGEPPPGATATSDQSQAARLPFWADAAGLQPDPDRPGVNVAGDHYLGNPDAPLVVIEFSDFECPFCANHALEVQPVLNEALVETGQVLWVFKHLPLPIHPSAPAAAVASECAGDQGRFWEMHDLLFATVDRWAGDGVDTDAALRELAASLGLDGGAFDACLTGREALERVLADMEDARGIVSQTPSFALIQDGRGTLLEGSRAADQFLALLEARLSEDTG